ncbi:MAG: MptD family putative ECF transporter S component [Deltaproteobacteria bacterium]|jgi:energy-coupling factor transport system substrate-specific component|nr:MptD family putative ECF transporter S component [Deltaproteobacteria bacterium]
MPKIIQFGIKESLTVGIFTALALVLNFALLMVLHFLPGALLLFKESAVAFLAAPIMVLLWTKVPKSGILTVFGAACGIVYVLFGFFTVAVSAVLGGLAGDLLAGRSGYASLAKNIAGYGLFSVCKALGTYIPFYLWGGAFVRDLAARGNVSQDFIDIFVNNLKPGMGLLILAVNFILAGLGVLAGERWLRRHFRPAGAV